jgi:hypothetical protein
VLVFVHGVWKPCWERKLVAFPYFFAHLHHPNNILEG